MKKFSIAWLVMATLFFLTCYGLIWVADDFGFHAIADIFLGDGYLGYLSMIFYLAPGIVALVLAAWLTRRPLF
jgi:hypothetical protein